MRSYGQFCSLARALDVVGDRWAMLIVRNLLLGPQRWSELRHDLPGVATNLLAERLRHLEGAGVVEVTAEGYRLTAAGAALQPALFALAAWGEAHRSGPPTADEAVRIRYLMTSLRRRIRPTAVRGRLDAEVDGDWYAFLLGPAPSVRQRSALATSAAEDLAEGGAAPLSLQLSGPVLRALVFGATCWRALQADGALAVVGACSSDGDAAALIDAWAAAIAWRPPANSTAAAATAP